MAKPYPVPFGVSLTSAPGSRTKEVGSTGLNRTGGWITDEFLPQLRGVAGAKVYDEMARNDPLCAALLFALEMLLRQATWEVEPAGKDRESQDGADLVRSALFEQLTTPWEGVVAEACSMLTFGYAPMEIVWGRDDDRGLFVPRKLALRNQLTVDHWEFHPNDSGELLGFWQQDWIKPPVFIPYEKVLNFRTDSRLNNPEGRSSLRGAYIPWMRKKTIEEAEGRAALRAAGVVELRIPSEIMLDESNRVTYEAYKTLATALAADRQGSVILPSDVDLETKTPRYELKYTVADGRRPADMSPIVERYDKRIATTVMADFLLLGQQAVGSFALSSDKTALFSTAIGSFLDLMEGTLNRDLLRRMWKYNGYDPKTTPKLRHGDVETPNLAELGAFIQTLAGVGMPLFPDEDLERYMRKTANLPEVKEGETPARALAVATQAQAAGLGGEGDDEEESSEETLTEE